ncbi:hypothetical protein FE697_007210 [Mumia zhuanghuii]|uniref:Uncharacterized protein n=2 Tax=Mumia TaxID=1546255 RepID=A0ABW1QLU4_9ACTN|nr:MULTISPECIES: hypothetical protein [Mumia]KAA1423392.1 hypothetical protein FE697_007210 [Mumia zhuanghuii]
MSTQEKKVRRLARQSGFHLWKVRVNDHGSAEYAPYALVDLATNSIGPRGLMLDQVEDWLRS